MGLNQNDISKLIQQEIEKIQSEMKLLDSPIISYDLLESYTYYQGLDAIREAYINDKAKLQPKFTKKDGTKMVRPLTFEETIEAKINNYHSIITGGKLNGIEDELSITTTSTWMIYDGDKKVKIIDLTDEVTIPEDKGSSWSNKYTDEEKYLFLDYNKTNGIELDLIEVKYSKIKTREEIFNHPGWNAVIKNKSLLKEYIDLVFKYKYDCRDMGFEIFYNDLQKDTLGFLGVFDIRNGGNVRIETNFKERSKFVILNYN